MSLHYLFERGLPEDLWVLECDELRFVLKDPSGQVMIRTDGAQVHRLIGVHQLYAAGTIRLKTPVGPLTFRAHPDTVSELRAVVAAGVRSDAEFRQRLNREAQRTILLGVALFLGGWAVVGLLIGWLSQLPAPSGVLWLLVLFFRRVFLWLILLLFAAAGLLGPYWVYVGTRQLIRLRRIERESPVSPRPAGFPAELAKPKPAGAK
jgi:hypothetical protein